MKYSICVLILFAIGHNSYAKTKNIPTYPSGIKVNFTINEEKIIVEEKIEEQQKSRRKKKIRNIITNVTSTTVPRFIRVINSISDLNEQEYLSLLIFDADNNIIESHIVTNTIKPTPDYIFFMDRQSGRSFKGKFDLYHFPKNAVSFTVAIIDQDHNIIYPTSHPGYNANQQITIAEFKEIARNKTMLQFEVLGSAKKNLTRIAAFQF
ncbi:MAG: hypothetical protein ACRCVW_01715 [Brevinema sp.]